MIEKLEQLAKEPNLRPYFTKVIDIITVSKDFDSIAEQIDLAPFIRKFASTCVNYYGLKKSLPFIKSSGYENRLEEFYSQLAGKTTTLGLSASIPWLLSQKIDSNRDFFPRTPVAINYQGIIRGLNVINELINVTVEIDDTVYTGLQEFANAILNPTIDKNFDIEAKQLLEKLVNFDARREGVSSSKFVELSAQIKLLNSSINTKLMSNNTYVSLVQQITEINRALKTVFRMSFQDILGDNPAELEHFWEGLLNHGYIGGENFANGNYEENQKEINVWLTAEYTDVDERVVEVLENAHNSEELPQLEKEDIPEAMELYTLNLLGSIGLKNDSAIRLMLGYHSRFVSKTIREGAFHNLRKNGSLVQNYFFNALASEHDYEQKLIIAEKHDSIFEKIKASLLTSAFGQEFQSVLGQLNVLIGPEGIWLNDFLKSAYMKSPQGTDWDSASTTHVQSQITHFETINSLLAKFKEFVEGISIGVFQKIVDIWGLNYITSWALSDYNKEQRLFKFVVEAAVNHQTHKVGAIDASLPLQDIISLLVKEPDAKQLIEKLMTFLLNSRISFDFPLFRSLLRIVAQRNIQIQGGVNIRDGFSEQRGYTDGSRAGGKDESLLIMSDPHIFHPIVIFLITILNMKAINIPKDAFVETDISLYLNSLAGVQRTPELGYQIYLANKLISSIPYIVDFGSQHEVIIRKTIADLDEHYERKNTLIHYHRIKIHRAPSRLDLDFCLEILDGLSSRNLTDVLHNLTRLMKGIGDEAIPDMVEFFELNSSRLQNLGFHLKALKKEYADVPWTEIAETQSFRLKVIGLPGIDEDSVKIIIALIRLASALSTYWSQRISEDFFSTVFTDISKEEFDKAEYDRKLSLIREKRLQFQTIINKPNRYLEPYQHIFLKRHVIQCDWNFDFFGFWPFYSESKFEAYNLDRKLGILERRTLEEINPKLDANNLLIDVVSEDILNFLQIDIKLLVSIMRNLIDEGLAPSKFFIDTIEILEKDALSISQLNDIIGILLYRELSHIDAFVANTFGNFPEQITKALGRENLDYGLETLSSTDEELLYPLVQETVVGNIIADAQPIPLLEKHLVNLKKVTERLSEIDPSRQVFPPRPSRDLSPVTFGYKSYALITLERDGFNVPALETLTVNLFRENPHLLQKGSRESLKSVLIDRILKLEDKTGKCFNFEECKLTEQQKEIIKNSRQSRSNQLSDVLPLLLSARSGSYRSMPGILGTVINIGYGDIKKTVLSDENPMHILSIYKMFLSTFGNVVFGIKETDFFEVLKEHQPGHLGDLSNEQILSIIEDFKKICESANSNLPSKDQIEIDWTDPLDLLAHSTLGVWESWDSESAINLRQFLSISDDWRTPVTLMDMKLADKNPQSFSAILFSGDPQGKTNRPNGDLLFGRPGEDIAAGLASEGTSLDFVEENNPALYKQIVDLMEQIKINKGNIDVDVELVGEYDPVTDNMEIFVIQERQMPLGTKAESDDFRLEPTEIAPLATGEGVNGGVQYGVFLDGVTFNYHELVDIVAETRRLLGNKDNYHSPGIFLLMAYVTPEEALKMNIPGVDGAVSSNIGKSSHASISAKRDGKLFICEADIKFTPKGWQIGKKLIRSGNVKDPDIFTLVANPKSVSPYSGNIYSGKLPLIKVSKRK
jgi:hypothetical protein